jgi:hypothetical protein
MQRLNAFEDKLSSGTSGQGASLVGVEDSAGHFTGTTVEEVLAELASGVSETDLTVAAATTLTIAAGVVTATQSYHTIDTEASGATDDLDTINGLASGQFYVFKSANAGRNVVFKHNTGNIKCPSSQDITLDVTNDKVYGFSDGTSLFVLGTSLATATGGGLAKDLSLVTTGHGASLVGIEDAASRYTSTTVEAALAEVAAPLVVATVASANATGGATTALISVQLKGLDNSTNIASAKQLLLLAPSVQYLPSGAGAPNVSLTLGTVTAGSILATLVAGYAWLVETSAAGLFACTATNTDDETVYWNAGTATGGVADVTKRCVVVGSNSSASTWSA